MNGRSLSAFLAAVTLALLVVTGTAFAGGQSEKTNSASLASLGFQAQGWPIVTKPMTITVAVIKAAHNPTHFADMTLIKELEKKSNVDLKFQEIPQTSAQEKVNLMFASRQFPDIAFNIEARDDQVFQAGQGGDIYALNELINKYAPHWKKALAGNPYLRKVITFGNGKIYGLPYYVNMLNDYGIRDIWAINTAWLKKLGLKMPRTTEQYYQVLLAFKKGSEEGILPKDAIPWYFRFQQYVGGEFDIYNAFGVHMLNNQYIWVDNGKVKFAAVNPQLEPALNYLHKLYSHGLIPPEIFTDAWDAYISKTRSNPPITGAFGSYFIVPSIEKDYTALPPLNAPGVAHPLYRSQLIHVQKNMFMIFTKFKYPAVAMRLADEFANPVFALQASYGAIGHTITKNANGTYTVTGTGADWFKDGPHNFAPAFIPKSITDKVKWTGEQGLRQKYVETVYKPYVWPQDQHYPLVTYTTTEQQEVANLQQQVDTQVQKTFANWIVNGGVDKGWNAYVEQLHRLGLNKLMKIYQDALDRFNAK